LLQVALAPSSPNLGSFGTHVMLCSMSAAAPLCHYVHGRVPPIGLVCSAVRAVPPASLAGLWLLLFSQESPLPSAAAILRPQHLPCLPPAKASVLLLQLWGWMAITSVPSLRFVCARFAICLDSRVFSFRVPTCVLCLLCPYIPCGTFVCQACVYPPLPHEVSAVLVGLVTNKDSCCRHCCFSSRRELVRQSCPWVTVVATACKGS
jgi:hypothetical protein